MVERVLVQVALTDDDAAGGRIKIAMPPAASFSAVVAWAQSFVATLPGMSDCGLRELTVSRTYVYPDVTRGAPGSDVNRVLVLILETQGGGYALQRIPACKDVAPDVPGAPAWSVDLEAPALVALVDALKAPGVVAGGGHPVPITGLVWAYVGWEV